MHVPGYKTVLSFYRTSLAKRLTLYYCSFLIVLVISFPSPSVAQVSQVDNDFSAGGGIRIGAAAGTCDGTIDGALRYNTGNLEVCNGSAWLTTLTSSLNPVVNNGNSFSAAMVIGTNDSNTLSFETNGTTHMTISTSGDVGIGTTSPSSALDLNGAATVRAMAAPAISSAGQGRIYFDSTSNTFKVSENGGAYSNLVNTSNGDFLADGSVPMTGAFLAASSGTAAAPSISFNGDSNTGFRGTGDSLYISTGGTERGYFDSYGSFNWYATIGMSRTKHGNGSASYPSVSFTNSENTGLFRPAYNVLAISTASTERVRINAAGNVGIGTTSPATTLDVSGTDALIVPQGTTAQRPGTGENGMIRYNSTITKFEAYENGAWTNMILDPSQTSALIQGWPDAIVCLDGASTYTYKLYGVNATYAYYTLEGYGSYYLAYSATTKNYSGYQNVSASTDCRSNTWSISDLISNGRAKYFGNDVGSIAQDDDNDTKIMVEKTVNENKIHFDTAGSERMIIDDSGNVGIGTATPTVELDVIGDIEYTGVITDVSDRRRKEDIQPLQNGLATIEKIDGVSFVMKGDESKRVEFGVIAQDVEKVLPELVHIAKDEDQTRSVNYIGFIGWMIEAIKDLARGDRQLQKQLNAKDQKISELEDRVQKLEEFILKNK